MSKIFDVIKSVSGDAISYFITNKDSNKVANNAVVASTAVAIPDIVNVLQSITAGVSVESAVATGGASMYIAFGIIAFRFALYVIGKAKA